ncbi:MAG: hypothetical protein AAFZ87_12485 [Planctomycetota bacterium]
MLTYYPLDAAFQVLPLADVPEHVDAMLDLADGKPLHPLEAGYPSAAACGSSEAVHAGFVDILRAKWRAHAAAIPSVNLVWLCDLDAETVEALCAYYGSDAEAFAGFLGSLGLRTHAGEPKPAWERLVQRRAR